MSTITLRIIDGADRGKTYADLSTPVSIGREAGNSIQLNDDRVSRFHMKIHMDRENYVLTDLESTNGTMVNGEEASVKILRFGDVIRVGRSTMVFGSREQINRRLQKINCSDLEKQLSATGSSDSSPSSPWANDPNYQLRLLEGEPPAIPARMSPGQAAQFVEVMEYLHLSLRKIVSDVQAAPGENRELQPDQWQLLLDLQARLAEYIRKTTRP
ncbi:MAG: FHA domain-containing protein [Pirellulaceae bacterium]